MLCPWAKTSKENLKANGVEPCAMCSSSILRLMHPFLSRWRERATARVWPLSLAWFGFTSGIGFAFDERFFICVPKMKNWEAE
jgi:hypothetical protein